MKKLIVLDCNSQEVYVYGFNRKEYAGHDTDTAEEIMRNNNHRTSECSWMMVDKLTLVIDSI